MAVAPCSICLMQLLAMCRHELRSDAVPENAMDGGVPDKGGSPGQDARAWAWEGTALAGQLYLSIAQASQQISITCA